MGGHILEILVMLIIAAILGFLIAWFWRAKKIEELQTYINTLEEKNNQLQTQLNDAEKALLDCQADKKRLDADKENLEKLLANCKAEKDKFEADKNETAQLLTTCKDTSKKLNEAKIDVENQLAECLKTKTRFETEKNDTIKLLDTSKTLSKKLEDEKSNLEKQLSSCEADKKSLVSEKDNLNKKLSECLNDKKQFESDKNDIEKLLVECQGNLMTSGVNLFNKEVDNEEYVEELNKIKKDDTPAKPLSKQEEALERVKAKAEKIDFARIGTANESEKDDLKIIKGIGPFIEKKLNALGIYRFVQIANLNDEDKDLVNEAIEFFPGRVKRDDWVGQAIELAKS